MAEQVVGLAPGESKQVSFEAVPTEVRSYQVSVNGLMGSFAVVAPAAPKFYMPAEMTVKVTNGTIFDMYHKCEFSCPITNLGNAIGTHTLWGERDFLGPFGPFSITLAPGETWTWSTWMHVDFSRVSAPYTVKLFGDWEEDNYSVGKAYP